MGTVREWCRSYRILLVIVKTGQEFKDREMLDINIQRPEGTGTYISIDDNSHHQAKVSINDLFLLWVNMD